MRAMIAIVLLACCAVLGGCKPIMSGRPADPTPPPQPPALDPPREPARQPQPAAQPKGQPAPPTAKPAPAVMATVNGRPVYMKRLHDLLVRAYGIQLAQQLIVNELVRQAAADKGITVTPDDIQVEHDRSVREAFPSVAGAAQRERLLEQMLVKRQLPRQQWNMAMRRNALLRKLVPKDIEVTEAELRDAFGKRYGRQVVVRHIQTASLNDAQKVLGLLTAGADFAAMAQKHSTNESRTSGGLLPAFTRDTKTIPPAIREVGLSMKTPGELSNPIQVGTTFHLLKLERILDPKNVKFENVKAGLTQLVREAKARIIQKKLLADLIKRARDDRAIEYVDPVLKARADREKSP